jgi:pilus assembly protein CpaC
VINLIQVERQFAEVSARTLETASSIKQALNNSALVVRALPVGVVIVEGKVGTDAELAQISLLLKGYAKEGKDDKGLASSNMNVEQITIVNGVTVNTSIARQVIVHAQVVDVNKNNLKDLGSDVGKVLETDDRTVVDQPWFIGQFPNDIRGIGDFTNMLRLSGIGTRIRALEEQKKAKTLARPNLTVLDGKEGSILVGGEIPVPISQGAGTSATVTIQWKEFGVRLTFAPVVTSDETIQLKIMPEVSTLDFANAVTLSGFQVPALRTRRAETVVNVHNGESFVLGGLLQSEKSKTVRKIPLLGDLPIIGELFKTRSWTNSDTELVIVITPEIVQPTATSSGP